MHALHHPRPYRLSSLHYRFHPIIPHPIVIILSSHTFSSHSILNSDEIIPSKPTKRISAPAKTASTAEASATEASARETWAAAEVGGAVARVDGVVASAGGSSVGDVRKYWEGGGGEVAGRDVMGDG